MNLRRVDQLLVLGGGGGVHELLAGKGGEEPGHGEGLQVRHVVPAPRALPRPLLVQDEVRGGGEGRGGGGVVGHALLGGRDGLGVGLPGEEGGAARPHQGLHLHLARAGGDCSDGHFYSLQQGTSMFQ